MMPKKIYIHHSADSSTKDQFEKINNYHQLARDNKGNFLYHSGSPSSLGFYGGYNKLIERDGTIETYRKEGEETAAQKGDNKEALSVCLAGHFDKEPLLNTQKQALLSVLKTWMAEYNIPHTEVYGHRKIGKTSCPGANIPDSLILQLAKEADLRLQISLLIKVVELLKKLLSYVIKR